MNIRINTSVYLALQALAENGYVGYLVGGAVRDRLMGNLHHDLDITTDAPKEEILRIFRKYKTVDIGTKFGTVLVIICGIQLEITPHRYESSYKDHRHPEEIYFIKDLREDLARRDFTINAIAYSPIDGFIDYFGGIDDIKNKTIRCVGDPYIRFDEDALRILRAVRFSFTLNFTIEEQTKKALFDKKDLLSFISMERKIAELYKLLQVDIYPAINEYKDVLNTFIKMNETDEKVDLFDNWLLKLAYILDDSFIDKLHSLKLSGNQAKLVRTLMSSKRLNFKDDYIFNKVISETEFQKELIQFKSVYDDINYSSKYNLLKGNLIDQIMISGKDLVNLGYQGPMISSILEDVKDNIYTGQIRNLKSSLLNYVLDNYDFITKVKLIKEQEYQKYFNHFTGNNRSFNDSDKLYLAFLRNKELTGVIELKKEKYLSVTHFVSSYGIIADYKNNDTLSGIVDALKLFIKDEKGSFLKMTVDKEVISKYQDLDFKNTLISLGFKSQKDYYILKTKHFDLLHPFIKQHKKA